MNRDDWQEIKAAKDLLGLGERASLSEIKQAFRRLAKKRHPDLAGAEAPASENSGSMHELTEAYRLLLDYCSNFRYPLAPNLDEPMDAEDWWMDRFGQDPLWGKGNRKNQS